MKKILIFLLFTFSFSIDLSAQTANYKCYPTNWWTGMKNDSLQVMIYGDKIADKFPMIKMGPGGMKLATGVSLIKINRVENPNYVFLDLVIDATAKPCKFSFPYLKDIKLEYELKQRRDGNGTTYAQGVTSSDFIYLIMPDRFSDSDPSNDKYADQRDTLANRDSALLRHGGDLKGVTNHLDYIKELGVTALWLTPVLQNNMPLEREPSGMLSGYHGYWITNHYEVDKRFGGNSAYTDMINAAHKKGLKVIQDAVYNHVGAYHWFVLDPPMKDWINNWPAYQGTNHREEVFIDPYAAAADKEIMVKGWFVPHLPDLNLANPYLAKYIIQNSIWATQEFGIDGWRVDTYKYNDEIFLNKINKALLNEFPSLTVFGEVTSNTVTASAYFTNNNINTPFKHNLQGVTDFPVCYAMLAAINDSLGWTMGVNRMYMTLAQDLLYKDPKRNCIFLDNHDMDRFLSVAGEDYNKFKLGITLLLTLRGIPQLYYGTEILMKNFKNPSDAEVRKDFPGGWAGDKENKFSASGRTDKENDAFNYIKSLAAFRKSSSALKTGNTMQYIPADGVYVYFRYDKDQTMMVAMNGSTAEKKISLDRFAQRTKGFTQSVDVITKNKGLLKDITLGSKQIVVLELIK